MDVGSLYRSKLTTPDQAMVAIPSGSKLSMDREQSANCDVYQVLQIVRQG